MVKRTFRGIVEEPVSDFNVIPTPKRVKSKLIKVRRIWAVPRDGVILVRRLDDRGYYLADWDKATPPERIFEVSDKALRKQ